MIYSTEMHMNMRPVKAWEIIPQDEKRRNQNSNKTKHKTEWGRPKWGYNTVENCSELFVVGLVKWICQLLQFKLQQEYSYDERWVRAKMRYDNTASTHLSIFVRTWKLKRWVIFQISSYVILDYSMIVGKYFGRLECMRIIVA